MKITRTPDGCTVVPDSPHVDRVLLEYDPGHWEDDSGRCTVFFRDGSTASFAWKWERYHVYVYGLCFSEDGKILYTGDWYKGLYAIDSRSGETLWHYRPAKIRGIYVFPGYLLALRYGSSLVKLDLHTGELLGELTGRSLEHCWRLDGGHVLLDSRNGRLCAVDTETLETVKTYRISGAGSLVNPRDCLALAIRKAWLEAGKLYISGFEKYPGRDPSAEDSTQFVRELDWL